MTWHVKSPLEEILTQVAFTEMGIVPLPDRSDLDHDINKVLASLPPAEARKMRRKFRKLWRRSAKNPPKGLKPWMTQLGLGQKEPNRKQKRYRKSEIVRTVGEKVRAAVAAQEEAQSSEK